MKALYFPWTVTQQKTITLYQPPPITHTSSQHHVLSSLDAHLSTKSPLSPLDWDTIQKQTTLRTTLLGNYTTILNKHLLITPSLPYPTIYNISPSTYPSTAPTTLNYNPVQNPTPCHSTPSSLH